MKHLGFTFTYQRFVRYLQGNCDSEQLTDGTTVNENWLYSNVREYLSARASSKYDLRFDDFTPKEWETGKRGHPKKLDIVGFKKGTDLGQVSMLMEAKLLIDPKRDYTEEIIQDIFRVATVQDRTHRRTKRYILVVGQKRCWKKVEESRNGILTEYLPFEKGFWKKKRSRSLNDKRIAQLEPLLGDFVEEVKKLKSIKTKLKGLAFSNIMEEELKHTGIDVRLWRIYPYS